MPVSEQDFEAISAYLDGQLSADQRRALEARLAEDAALRSALDDLRGTLAILQAVPRLAPPRNFTLDPVKYRRARPWWARYGAMQTIGAIGALASAAMIMIVAFVFSQSGSAAMAPAANRPGPQDAIALNATATASEIKDHNALQSGAAVLVVTSTPAPATPAISTATSGAQESASDKSAAAPQLANAPSSTPPIVIPAFTAAELPSPTVPTMPPTTAPMVTATALSLKSGAQPAPLSPQSAQSGAAAVSGGANQPNTLAQPGGSGQGIIILSTFTPSATATPTPTLTPTATSTPTATDTATALPSPTPTSLPSATPAQAAKIVPTTVPPTSIALAATPGSLPPAGVPQTAQPLPIPQLLMILAIALFVFFSMLFGVGWMRRRLEGTINDKRE